MKSLYLFFCLFCLSLTGGVIAQSPRVLNLQQDQTIDLSKFAGFDAIPNHPDAQKMRLRLLISASQPVLYEKTVAVTGREMASQTFAYTSNLCFQRIHTYPNTSLIRYCRDFQMSLSPNQSYLLELTTYDASGQWLGQSQTHFFTGSLPLQSMTITPFTSPGATQLYYPTAWLIPGVGTQNAPLVFQRTHPETVFILGFIYDKETGTRLEIPYSCADNFQYTLHPETYAQVGGLYKPIAEQVLVIQELDQYGRAVSYGEYSFRVIYPQLLIPQPVYPLNGQTNVSLTPVFQLKNPKNELSIQQPRYHSPIRYRQVFLSEAEGTAQPQYRQGGGPLTTSIFSWQPPEKLKPFTKYILTVQYEYNNPRTSEYIPYSYTISFTTGADTQEPVLRYPNPDSIINLCGNKIRFTANGSDSTAKKLSLKVFVNDPRELIFEQVKIFATPAEALRDQAFDNVTDNLAPYQQYLAEVKTTDANGQLIQQRYFTFITDKTGTQSAYPVVTSPTEVASLTPTLSVQPITQPFCGEGLREVFYAIDKYPADWTGKDYQSRSKIVTSEYWNTQAANLYQWTPDQPLEPNTTYQGRVSFFAPGALGTQMDYVTDFTFTTGSEATRLARPETGSTSLAMPNPFSNELTIQLDKKYTQAQIQLIGMKGQIIAQQKGSALKPVVFCGENLTTGLYVIRITDATGKGEQFKVIKQ